MSINEKNTNPEELINIPTSLTSDELINIPTNLSNEGTSTTSSVEPRVCPVQSVCGVCEVHLEACSADICEGSCMTSCERACQNCEGECESSCMTACERHCMNCEGVACQTTQACTSGCEVTCETSCEDTCETTCELSCQYACQDTQTCTSGCQITCETSCEDTCETTCELSCQYSCQDSCQDSCELSYQRPNDWVWTSPVEQNLQVSYLNDNPYYLTAEEWNNFTTRINLFRAYKGLSAATFTTAVKGQQMMAAQANEAIDAISAMNPSVAVPSAVTSNSPITAQFINGLANSLNSL